MFNAIEPPYGCLQWLRELSSCTLLHCVFTVLEPLYGGLQWLREVFPFTSMRCQVLEPPYGGLQWLREFLSFTLLHCILQYSSLPMGVCSGCANYHPAPSCTVFYST